jgi:nitrogen fixation protein FixH
MTYNRYTNYETWAVGVVIDNTRSELEAWREKAADIRESAADLEQVKAGTWTEEEAARFTLADALRETHEILADEAELPAPLSDLLSAAVSSVNWAELADDLLEEV